MNRLPRELRDDMARAVRLEWWTLFWMSTVVAAMYFAMGSIQAMKAFLEDLLGLMPAITFLIAAKLEPREPTERYPFAFVRVNSLAFLASAVVLFAMGAWLLFDAAMSLMKQEHPTVGPIELFGQTVWLGWIMIAALAYSVVPPVILGRLKRPIAERMRDKVLHTDALMQKADWQTGLAGIAGILGIGLGFWWADSAAAAFISFSILRDGLANIRTASAELVDGVPRELDGHGISSDAEEIRRNLLAFFPDGNIRLRESGRYVIASIDGVRPPETLPELRSLSPADAPWRLTRLTFAPASGQDDSDEGAPD
jgi:cobalt-zinc-cadmium efflux system protein